MTELDMMVYSDDDGYWVRDDPNLSYYEILAPAATHSYRIAAIGKCFGLQRAIDQIAKHAART